MCGQFTLEIEENEKLAQIYLEAQYSNVNISMNSGTIKPTHIVPVITFVGKKISAIPMKWGYPKFNSKGVIINARSENYDTSMFKSDFKSRRCVVPSSGFFEWDNSKNKFHFVQKENPVLYMAGIFSNIESIPCFSIVTTIANSCISDIHDRMPVILCKENALKWLKISDSDIYDEQKNIEIEKILVN